MNLHAIVTPLISTVNPPTVASVRAYAGSNTAADGTRQPNYNQTDGEQVQVQPISGKDLFMLNSLNIQGIDKAVYMNGALIGATRVGAKGGDMLAFDGSVWLVTVVLELWRTGWCKVGVTLQKDAPWPPLPEPSTGLLRSPLTGLVMSSPITGLPMTSPASL